MAQLLSAGKHVIKPVKGFEGPTCGLVPLNGPATITTQGLKWNLGKCSLQSHAHVVAIAAAAAAAAAAADDKSSYV